MTATDLVTLTRGEEHADATLDSITVRYQTIFQGRVYRCLDINTPPIQNSCYYFSTTGVNALIYTLPVQICREMIRNDTFPVEALCECIWESVPWESGAKWWGKVVGKFQHSYVHLFSFG